MKFQYAIVFLLKANNDYAVSQVLEMRGIYLHASPMQSEGCNVRAASTLL